MTPARWQQIEALFDELVDLPTDAREARLAGVCVDDPQLRSEIESLLAALVDAPTRLHQVIAREAGRLGEASALGQRFGPYRVLRTLGEGGMGVVYLAERDDGEYRTQVAIKLLRGPIAATSDDAVARLRDERQILASLVDPGIVRLLDGGHCEAGPYLVMEYVDGVPITRYALERRLSLVARLELFVRVASAVAFAHQRLIVHRDLKPSNILVTGDGTPKLLDFGIAKLLADEGPLGETATRTGMQRLTLEYASPEQLRGEPLGTATDIFSLGAVLFELCTDTKLRPLQAGGGEALLRALLAGEPTRPSSVAPLAFRRALRGDLDSIVLAALHPHPQQRYASVEQLIDDLERHLGGLPVKAREATWVYRASKFVRRNAVAVFAATSVAATLIAATLVSREQARRADAHATEAEHLRELADTQAELARHEAALAHARALALRDAMRVGAARHALQVGDDPTSAVLLLREVESPPEHVFGWLSAVPHFSTPSFVTTHVLVGSEQASGASWSPDGERIASAGAGTAVQVWSAEGEPLVAFGSERERGGDIVWSPDGTLLAVAARGGVAAVWRVDGTQVATLGEAAPSDVAHLRWSPDGSTLASFGEGKAAQLWSRDGTPLASLEAHAATVAWAAWSATGQLVTASPWDDPSARIWTRDGTLVRSTSGHARGIHAAVWSPDGRSLVTASDDATARIVPLAGGEAIVLAAHDGPILAAAWSPNGQQVALASRDHRLSIWRLDGTLVATLGGHAAAVVAVQWSPSGRWLASASEDHDARVWTAAGAHVGTLAGQREPLRTVSWRPRASASDVELDDEALLTVAYASPARTWRAAGGLPTLLVGHRDELRGGAWSPDGRHIATASDDATARVWSLDGTPLAIMRGHAGAVREVVWSPDATRVLTRGEDRSVRSWSVDGDPLAQWDAIDDAEPLAIAWGPRIAIAYEDGRVRLWHDDGRLHATLDGHRDAVRSVAWSPQGLLLTGSWDASAAIWRLDGTLLTQLIGHAQAVQAAAFSPDGTRIVTTSMDRSARIWRADGSLIARLPGRRMLEAAAFSPDGTRLVTTGIDDAVRLWTAEGSPIARLAGHTAEPGMIEWDSQGTRVLTASSDGTARLWSADGLPLATLDHDWSVTAARFSPDGVHVLTTSELLGRIWLVDPERLRRGFWLSTPRCSSPDERQRVLAEAGPDAEAGHASCMGVQACLRDAPHDDVARVDACIAPDTTLSGARTQPDAPDTRLSGRPD